MVCAAGRVLWLWDAVAWGALGVWRPVGSSGSYLSGQQPRQGEEGRARGSTRDVSPVEPGHPGGSGHLHLTRSLTGEEKTRARQRSLSMAPGAPVILKSLWYLSPHSHRMGYGAAVRTRGVPALLGGGCRKWGSPAWSQAPRVSASGAVWTCPHFASGTLGLPRVAASPASSIGALFRAWSPEARQPLPPCWGLAASLPPGPAVGAP